MGATEGLASAEQQARSVLKVLDALILRAIGSNAALLATWQGARKIYYRAGGATASAVPAPAPATQATPIVTPAGSTPASLSA
jgi:hypothetical protein